MVKKLNQNMTSLKKETEENLSWKKSKVFLHLLINFYRSNFINELNLSNYKQNGVHKILSVLCWWKAKTMEKAVFLLEQPSSKW